MTGGGIYPALAVHQAIVAKTEAALWVGSENGLEQNLLASFNIPFKSISGGGIHGMGTSKKVRNFFELVKGYREAKLIVREFKPDIIFYTGGFIGVPMALAARNIPSVVFIPDIEPGLALKTILRNAHRILVSTQWSKQFINYPEKVQVTGYPLRNEIKEWSRDKGRAYFGINNNERVVLIFGGSKGAKSINDALVPGINELTKDMHVIHLTGSANWEECQSMVSEQNITHPEKYHAFPFLHSEMGAALSAADLVVCRAGASTIGELPFFGLPAILVPYPYAWRYQKQNADYLISHNAAYLLEDDQLKSKLISTIQELIHDTQSLSEMKKNMQGLAIDNAAGAIANAIIEVFEEKKGGSLS